MRSIRQRQTANALRELGVDVDDRVMVLMLDVPQFYAVFWGAIKIGAIPIPVNTMLTPINTGRI